MPDFSGKVLWVVCRSGMLALSAFAMAACSSHGSSANPRSAPTPVSGKASTPLLTATNVAEWKSLLPVGVTLVASANGDLDSDGDEDTLLVYAPSPQQGDAARTLLVLLRDPGGVLRPVLTNPKAILCSRCGGIMGDPLQPIRTDRGGFTLRFEGGSRELWSIEFRFEHVKVGGWRLAQIQDKAFDRMGGASAEKRLCPKDFGVVMLDAFGAEDFPAGALP
jgi:hypothetical protein